MEVKQIKRRIEIKGIASEEKEMLMYIHENDITLTSITSHNDSLKMVAYENK